MSAAESVRAVFVEEASRHVFALSAALTAARHGAEEQVAREARVAVEALVSLSHIVEDASFVQVTEALAAYIASASVATAAHEDSIEAALSWISDQLSAARPDEDADPSLLVEQIERLMTGQAVVRRLSLAEPIPSSPRELVSVEGQADGRLLRIFREDLLTQAAELSSAMIDLEQESHRARALERLMRAAHSLKGAARMVGFHGLASLAHVIEDRLVAVQRGQGSVTARNVDQLLSASDLIAQLGTIPAEALPEQLLSRADEIRALSEALGATASPHGSGQGKRDSGDPPAGGPPSLELVSAAFVKRANENRASVQSIDTLEPDELAKRRVDGGVPGRITATPLESDERGTRSGVPNSRPSLEQTDDRQVRIAARNIERIMGLSGEAHVEARRFGVFVERLARVRKKHQKLPELFEVSARASNGAAELREQLEECHQGMTELLLDMERFGRTVEDLSGRLHGEALKSRMRPFSDAVQGLPRLARDTARSVGKEVILEFHGERTEVDRDVLEAIQHPLQHLVRNAVDHGLEAPELRRQAGKESVGKVRIEARHHAGMLLITVSDDGRGVDLRAVKQRALERGLADARMIERMSDAEVLEFPFLPGFSTAEAVTHVSGRGVGLDVVRSAVTAAAGTVRITTTRGAGATFHLRLPVTRSIIRAVLVEVGGESYAVPFLRVEKIVRMNGAEVNTLEGRPFVEIDGVPVGLVRAHDLLETEDPGPSPELLIVVVGERTSLLGLIVDRFVGEQDLVVRPLDARLGKVPNVSAAAMLADGSPALILDVDDVAREVHRLFEAGPRRVTYSAQPKPRKRVLVVDDSLTVRELERQLLLSSGYEVDVAVDGMDGFAQLSKHAYDLVISDIDMPRMNGFELVKQIKADGRYAAIPVVIVSYKDREEDRLRGLEAGASYYLTKSSFHDRSLIEAVTDLIGAPT